MNRNTAAKLIHNCWDRNQQSVLGQFSFGRVGQFSISANSEEVRQQLEIVPMQIRVIKHVRKVYRCRDCEIAPVAADKPAQLI